MGTLDDAASRLLRWSDDVDGARDRLDAALRDAAAGFGPEAGAAVAGLSDDAGTAMTRVMLSFEAVAKALQITAGTYVARETSVVRPGGLGRWRL